MRKTANVNKGMFQKAKVAPKSRNSATVATVSSAKAATSNRRDVTDRVRTVRIDARIPSHVKEIVQYAASIQGRSQTDFMVTAIHEAAQKVIAENSMIQLCLEDQKELAAALLNDNPPPNTKGHARLRRAVQEHGKKVISL